MEDGNIVGNRCIERDGISAAYGGGIYVASGASFTMKGGSIQGNGVVGKTYNRFGGGYVIMEP